MRSNRYGVKEVFATLQGEGLRAGSKSVFIRFTGCNLWNGQAHRRDAGQGPCAKWCDTDFFRGTVVDLESLIASANEAWAANGAGEDRPKWVVLTGGEPALQLDEALVEALHGDGWKIAIETNGTIECPALARLDHVCLSPKLYTPWHKLFDVEGIPVDEVKVILPGLAEQGQIGWTDEALEEVATVVNERRARRTVHELTNAEHDIFGLFVQPQDVIDTSVLDVSLLRTLHSHGSGLRRGLGLEEKPEVDPIHEGLYQAHVERCVRFVMGHSHWRLSLQTHKLIDMP